MKIKLKLIAAGLLAIAMIIVIAPQGKWDKYYKNKMDKPPHQILLNALDRFQTQGTAIELGCGVGNDALHLLSQGWSVWAIDRHPKAIQILKARPGPKEKLSTATEKFEEKSLWETLPHADLIYAAYALPFCKQAEFEKVWSHIKQHLTPNGRFAGHFFGTNYIGFSDKEMASMTFLNREAVLELFQDFDIEFFNEVEEDGNSGTGRPVHSHIFEVIAQNKIESYGH